MSRFAFLGAYRHPDDKLEVRFLLSDRPSGGDCRYGALTPGWLRREGLGLPRLSASYLTSYEKILMNRLSLTNLGTADADVFSIV